MTRNAVASSVNCMSSTLARMVPVRSTSVEISTPAGIHCFSLGDQRLHPVDGVDDVGVALLGDLDQHRRLLVEPGDRAAVADGILDLGDVGQPDEIAVRALDDDVAELGRGPHLPVDRQRLAWRPPSKMPTGPSGLALTIASRTSSVAIPAFDSATGLSAIRTAGWSAPETVTSPTPGTCEMRCAITVSATSYIALVEIVFEVSASTNTGRRGRIGLAEASAATAGRSANPPARR